MTLARGSCRCGTVELYLNNRRKKLKRGVWAEKRVVGESTSMLPDTAKRRAA